MNNIKTAHRKLSICHNYTLLTYLKSMKFMKIKTYMSNPYNNGRIFLQPVVDLYHIGHQLRAAISCPNHGLPYSAGASIKASTFFLSTNALTGELVSLIIFKSF